MTLLRLYPSDNTPLIAALSPLVPQVQTLGLGYLLHFKPPVREDTTFQGIVKYSFTAK